MWIFYPSKDDSLFRRLNDAHIPTAHIPAALIQISPSEERTMTGFSFPEENADQAFQILGIDRNLVDVSYKATNIEDVFLIETKRKSSSGNPTFLNTENSPLTTLSNSGSEENYSVLVSDDYNTRTNLSSPNKFQRVLAPYAGMFQKSIVLFVPHGKSQAPMVDENRVNIYFWSVPGKIEKTSIPRGSVFGVEIDDPGGVGDYLKPSGQGVLVNCPEGYPVAEVLPGNIYVLFDLPHRDFSGRDKILEEIVKAALPLALGKNEQEFAELFEEQKRKEIEKQRKAAKELADRIQQEALSAEQKNRNLYIEACKRRVSSIIGSAKTNVNGLTQEIANLSRTMIEKSRTLLQAQQELAALEKLDQSIIKNFANEFETLESLSDVEKVEVSEKMISVFTKEITFNPDHRASEHEQRSVFIGNVRIDIPIDGNYEQIRFNKISSSGSYHPHAMLGGDHHNRPCYGNIGNLVKDYHSRYEFGALVQLLIQYLKCS